VRLGHWLNPRHLCTHTSHHAQLLSAISALIDFEGKVLQSRTLHTEAEALLTAKPELLINRMVQHFRWVFGGGGSPATPRMSCAVRC
jgi:hypothetical protein